MGKKSKKNLYLKCAMGKVSNFTTKKIFPLEAYF